MTGPDRIGFAHRGGSGHGPDNQLDTFAAALRLGATALETDAWVTADGVVVLDHDGVLREARRRRQPIAQVRRDQLPAHVPTLDELYDRCGTEMDLAIDVSSARIAAEVAAVAARRHASSQLWLVSPHSARLANIDSPNRAVTVRGTTMRGPRRHAAFRGIRDAGMDAVNARWVWWTPRFVEEVHDLGMRAFGYDCQQPGSLRRALGMGLDAVFSDHVETMLAALAAVNRVS
jgi:glycerophosphoryl diester phosphodiesterase